MSTSWGLDGSDGVKDFTDSHYSQLLKILVAHYNPILFSNFGNASGRFVLWRHDVDFSLNRAARLAVLESEMGIRSTFLVDPHSAFYNLAERSQAALLQEIVEMGHAIGLHFDAGFWNLTREDQVSERVAEEARWIQFISGVRPEALSFHNPTPLHLSWNAESYAGLINCYSKTLMDNVPYASDSNGYWRYRRLYDVLTSATEERLQVLTHPGWWQGEPMSPRSRLFRAAFGRAEATMKQYDASLSATSRRNLGTLPESVRQAASLVAGGYELFDYLWSRNHHDLLFLRLWAAMDSHARDLSIAILTEGWHVPREEVNAFVGSVGTAIAGWRLLEVVSEMSDPWQAVPEDEELEKWWNVWKRVGLGTGLEPGQELSAGCLYLAERLVSLSMWGGHSLHVRGWAALAHRAGPGGLRDSTYGLPDGDRDGSTSPGVERASDRLASGSWKEFQQRVRQEAVHSYGAGDKDDI